MIRTETDLAYSIYSNQGAYALLIGSGLSRSAGIPTGWEIMVDLIKRMSVMQDGVVASDAVQWFKVRYGKQPDYSDLIEVLAPTREERLNLLRSYFEPTNEERENKLKLPTTAHRKIAELVYEGYIKVIVTTNFDRLLENAIKDVGIEPVVISNPSHTENVIPLIHSRITIFKIHGDYLDTKFLNIKSELETYDERVEKELHFIFENFGLLTCGWSAQWDEALLNCLKSANKFRFSNYFTYLTAPNEKLEEVSRCRNGHLLKIGGADQLFAGMVDIISSLRDYDRPSQLSTTAAIARIKHYIPRDEFVISLNDLVQDFTNTALTSLNTIDRPSPDLQNVKSALNKYLAIMESNLLILAAGSFWFRDIHSNIWIKALRRMAYHSATVSTSWTIWSEMAKIPLLLARYSFGIGCVANKNFNGLKLLCAVDVVFEREPASILVASHTFRTIRRDQLNAIFDNKARLPMQTLLYDTMRKIFVNYIPDEGEFQNVFDYYEYIICLMYATQRPNDFPPIGLFGLRDRKFIIQKINEASLAKDNFELISNGLLPNYDAFEKGVKKIDEVLNERFW